MKKTRTLTGEVKREAGPSNSKYEKTSEFAKEMEKITEQLMATNLQQDAEAVRKNGDSTHYPRPTDKDAAQAIAKAFALAMKERHLYTLKKGKYIEFRSEKTKSRGEEETQPEHVAKMGFRDPKTGFFILPNRLWNRYWQVETEVADAIPTEDGKQVVEVQLLQMFSPFVQDEEIVALDRPVWFEEKQEYERTICGVSFTSESNGAHRIATDEVTFYLLEMLEHLRRTGMVDYSVCSVGRNVFDEIAGETTLSSGATKIIVNLTPVALVVGFDFSLPCTPETMVDTLKKMDNFEFVSSNSKEGFSKPNLNRIITEVSDGCITTAQAAEYALSAIFGTCVGNSQHMIDNLFDDVIKCRVEMAQGK